MTMEDCAESDSMPKVGMPTSTQCGITPDGHVVAGLPLVQGMVVDMMEGMAGGMVEESWQSVCRSAQGDTGERIRTLAYGHQLHAVPPGVRAAEAWHEPASSVGILD
jgi:hypothetical protein